MRQYEGTLLAERSVELLVQPDGVLVDELIGRLLLGKARGEETLLGREAVQHIRLHPYEVASDVRWPDLQKRHVSIVVHGRNETALVDVEVRRDEFLLGLSAGLGVEQCDLEDVVPLQNLGRDAVIGRHEPARCDAAALAVASIAHLYRRLVDVLAAHG